MPGRLAPTAGCPGGGSPYGSGAVPVAAVDWRDRCPWVGSGCGAAGVVAGSRSLGRAGAGIGGLQRHDPGPAVAEADTLLAVRSTVSKLVNSGAVWGGLPILSGWLVRRRVQAAAAGIVACLVALVVHYGVGRLLGLFDPTVWTENRFWVVLAVVVGGPLALIGSAARRVDRWGLLARLVVPVGAVLEPF